jgi:hypothetical protein
MPQIKRRGFTLMVIYFGVISTVLAFWTKRNLDFWLTYHKGVPTYSPFWLDYLIAIFGPVNITLNLISEVVRLFI